MPLDNGSASDINLVLSIAQCSPLVRTSIVVNALILSAISAADGLSDRRRFVCAAVNVLSGLVTGGTSSKRTVSEVFFLGRPRPL